MFHVRFLCWPGGVCMLIIACGVVVRYGHSTQCTGVVYGRISPMKAHGVDGSPDKQKVDRMTEGEACRLLECFGNCRLVRDFTSIISPR